MTSIGFSNPQGTPSFQISFNPFEPKDPKDPYPVVVTGPNTYKYYKVGETEFTCEHSQLNNMPHQLQ